MNKPKLLVVSIALICSGGMAQADSTQAGADDFPETVTMHDGKPVMAAQVIVPHAPKDAIGPDALKRRGDGSIDHTQRGGVRLGSRGNGNNQLRCARLNAKTRLASALFWMLRVNR